MWKTMTVALAFLLGTMVTASAAAYHVIRTEEGCLVIAKEHCYLGDAYVDVRNWDDAEWEKRPALVSSILHVR